MIALRTVVLFALVGSTFVACSKHRLPGEPIGGATGGGSQVSDAASSASGGSASGSAGTAGSGAGGAAGIGEAGAASAGIGAAGATSGSVDAGPADASEQDGGAHDAQCTVALRMDTCCFDGVAVTYRQLRADPCLAEYPSEIVELERFESCRPAGCDVLSCASHRPPSYLAAPSANGCAFADECTRSSDCVLALEQGMCCACLQGMPASVALAEPCFIAESEDYDTSAACPYGACFDDFSECGDGGRAACSDDDVATCVIRDSFNICQ